MVRNRGFQGKKSVAIGILSGITKNNSQKGVVFFTFSKDMVIFPKKKKKFQKKVIKFPK
jgi:hypothetical protein